MDALIWILLGISALTLALGGVLLFLTVRNSGRLLRQLSRHELMQQRQREEDREIAARRHAELLSRLEQMKLELERKIKEQTEHSDRQRAEALANFRQELSDSIDRLENFLREPIL